MRRSISIVGVLVILVIVSMAGIGLAQEDDASVRGEPRIDVHLPDGTVTPGTTAEVTLQVSNDGRVTWGATTQPELVRAARNVRVEADDDGLPFTIETEEQAIGAVGTDVPGEVPLQVRVPNDAEPGTYEVDVTVRYSHTSMFSPRSGIVQERSRSVTRTVEIVIDDRPRIALHGMEPDVQVGDSGTIRAEVQNIGGQEARDIDVSIESTSPNVILGEPGRDSARISSLDANENTTIEFDVEIPPNVTVRNYSVDATARFTDPDGVRIADEGLSFQFEPLAEQSFSLELRESALRVGETGEILGSIHNEGPHTVEDVTLRLEEGQFEPRSVSYSIGELEPGDSADFQFRAIVPTSTDPAPQRIDITTHYRTAADNDRATLDSLHVPVADRRDAVAIAATEAEFGAGEDGVLELAVTNQRDEEMRDVRLTLAVEDPLDSDFRTTVISSLQPDETGTVAFDLEVDSNAPLSQYPAMVQVEYTDPDGESIEARPATVAISVTEVETEFFSIEVFIFIVMIILVGAAFYWLYRR